MSVMIGKACGEIHISNLTTLGFESASSSKTDHKVWLDGLDCQVCCQCSWNCPNIVHAMHSAFACTNFEALIASELWSRDKLKGFASQLEAHHCKLGGSWSLCDFHGRSL